MWRVASAAWLLDESGLAITLLEDAMRRLRAPGVRGTSGGSLTVLGWAYIADVITATVHALRADSATTDSGK